MKLKLHLKKPAAMDGPLAPKTTDGALDYTDIQALFAEFETPLLRYVERILGRRSSEGEDIVQETFIRLYSQVARNGRDSVENPASWLFKVARNLCMDHGRRQAVDEKAKATVEAERAGAAGEQHGLDAAVQREACGVAMEELDRLPEPEREVLCLKLFKDFKLREIGEVTGLTVSMADYRLNRALGLLRDRLMERGLLA